MISPVNIPRVLYFVATWLLTKWSKWDIPRSNPDLLYVVCSPSDTEVLVIPSCGLMGDIYFQFHVMSFFPLLGKKPLNFSFWTLRNLKMVFWKLKKQTWIGTRAGWRSPWCQNFIYRHVQFHVMRFFHPCVDYHCPKTEDPLLSLLTFVISKVILYCFAGYSNSFPSF